SGMLSEDGECYAFDSRANGLVPGEAVAVVVLKRLSKAEADGDAIYGVVRGSGVNYDGRTNGITAPSGLSQKMLIDQVYDNCRINAEEIGYVITHGTGTKLGDPVEVNSLIEAFNARTSRRSFCALGSTKPNIGHTFAASGMVSLIAMLMAIKYDRIPSAVNYERQNEFINLADSAFYINREARSWNREGRAKRLGAISSFGMSGTNAHQLIEEYLPAGSGEAASPWVEHSNGASGIVVLSARKAGQLKLCAGNLLKFLAKARLESQRTGKALPDLARIAYTLQMGREAMKHRIAFRVRNLEELEDRLREYLEGNADLRSSDQGDPERGVEPNPDLRKNIEKNDATSVDNRGGYDLAEMWVRGQDVDWDRLYPEGKPKKINLPTYPFIKDKYPPAEKRPSKKALATNGSGGGSGAVQILHPMVHEKLSV
ncbi:MAG TPA: beta-ketoacyl synthase N-terminal-like domain-containing protein, partial [Blastocatellia bacterium]|nr:beta-ketoacyl synthase N-terminal-like domain-containing protein [Blastocatellia bacterium]